MHKNQIIYPLSLKLGFWAALLGVVSIAVYIVCAGFVLANNPIFIWTNLDAFVTYANAYRSPFPDIARFSMLLFSLFFVIMLNSIHDCVRPEEKILAKIGLCFGLAFTILTGTFYFVQISAVRLRLLQANYVGLEQVVQANPYSAFAAMNMLAWSFFLGLASLFVAPIFSSGRLNQVLRLSFVANGIFCLLSAVGYIFEITWLLLITVNLGTGGALLIISVSLSLLFRRLARSQA